MPLNFITYYYTLATLRRISGAKMLYCARLYRHIKLNSMLGTLHCQLNKAFHTFLSRSRASMYVSAHYK